MFDSVPTFLLIAIIRFCQAITNGLQLEVNERNNKEEEEALRELQEHFGGVSISTDNTTSIPSSTPPPTIIPSSSNSPKHCQNPKDKACDYGASLAIGYCNSRTKKSQSPVWTYHCKTHMPYECRIRK
jgi:hypothetical protein